MQFASSNALIDTLRREFDRQVSRTGTKGRAGVLLGRRFKTTPATIAAVIGGKYPHVPPRIVRGLGYDPSERYYRRRRPGRPARNGRSS